MGICQRGTLRYFFLAVHRKARGAPPKVAGPPLPTSARKRRTTSARSGCVGFLTATGTSTPRKQSAISCTWKGLAVVRAPIHSMSIPALMRSFRMPRLGHLHTDLHSKLRTGLPASQGSPVWPTPSNAPGRVLRLPDSQTGNRRGPNLPQVRRQCSQNLRSGLRTARTSNERESLLHPAN